MSINMYLTNSRSQGNSAAATARSRVSGYEQLQKAIGQFVMNSPNLTSDAYDNAKNYYHSMLNPLAQGGILLSEAVADACKQLPGDYVANVHDTDLKESELMQQIEAMRSSINGVKAINDQILASGMPDNYILRQTNSNKRVIQLYQTQQQELQQRLNDLRTFDSTSTRIFENIDSIQALVTTGVGQANGCWNAGKGMFVIPSAAERAWATELGERWEIREKQKNATKLLDIDDIGKDEIVNDYMDTYGLDKEAAELLYQLQQGIIKKAEKESWDKDDIIFEFNRIIASCVPDSYVATRWEALCGVVNEYTLKKMLKKYGLNNSNQIALIEAIRKQHLNQDTHKDLAHEAIQLTAFTEKSWTPWTSQTNMLHRLSHIVNRGLDGVNYEKEEISFKGDVDSGRYSDSDFNSDLDAQNTYKRLTNVSSLDDVFKTTTQYNDGINKNVLNRTEEFYKTYGNGSVFTGKMEINRIMQVSTIGSTHISSSYSDEEKQKHLDDFNAYLSRGETSNAK